MKRCPKCDTYKSLDCFGKDNQKKDGLKTYCKECKKKDDAKYNIENKATRYPKQVAYKKNRRKTDHIYKMKGNVARNIRHAFTKLGLSKSSRTMTIIGCDWDTLKIHIESKFDEHMTWDNQGSYWDIDHIIPISVAKTEEEIIKLNHYTNLQPLERNENRNVKRNLMPEEYAILKSKED